MSAKGVISAQSAIKKEEVDSAAGTWEGDVLQDSSYAADLVQVMIENLFKWQKKADIEIFQFISWKILRKFHQKIGFALNATSPITYG